MSKAQKSNGKNQRLLVEFLRKFDKQEKKKVYEVIDYFSELKANGRERFDDCKQLELMILAGALGKKYGEIPTIVKKYVLIKLQQGASSWGINAENPAVDDDVLSFI